jgi:hypothetical protein
LQSPSVVSHANRQLPGYHVPHAARSWPQSTPHVLKLSLQSPSQFTSLPHAFLQLTNVVSQGSLQAIPLARQLSPHCVAQVSPACVAVCMHVDTWSSQLTLQLWYGVPHAVRHVRAVSTQASYPASSADRHSRLQFPPPLLLLLLDEAQPPPAANIAEMLNKTTVALNRKIPGRKTLELRVIVSSHVLSPSKPDDGLAAS